MKGMALEPRAAAGPRAILALMDEAQAQEALKAAENALNAKSSDFDYGAAAARLAEAAAQLRTVQQLRKGK